MVPRLVFDSALREAAVAAGAVPVQARITAVDADGDGIVRAVIASDGRRLAADVVIGADGALSPLARLAGMLDPDTALWGFAIRAYLPAEVPLPLLVLLDASPWRIYPGYGWLFPGADGQANVGIGVGLGTTRRQAPLRGDLARFCAMLAERGDIGPGVTPGPVTGGWLRMGGTGTPAAAGNVLLVGDAAGLINPLQGEGIAPGMVSARLAAEAVLAHPADPGPAYTEALAAAFGGYMPGAAALQDRAAAAATGRIGGHPAADRARGAQAHGRHLVALLERPGGWRPAAPVRLERGRGAAGGGAAGRADGGAVIRLPGPPPSPAAWLAGPGPGRPALITSRGSCAASTRSGTWPPSGPAAWTG